MKFTTEEQAIIDQAITIIESKINTGLAITSPQSIKNVLKIELAQNNYEVFAVVFLTTQNQIIEIREMFRGTIDTAAVYPREVAKAALDVNAKSVILAHNHPSDVAEPSQADRIITDRIKATLELFDIVMLDHIIVTKRDVFSFAESGLI